MNRIVFVGSKQLGLACLKTIHRCIPRKLVAAITLDDSADGRSEMSAFTEYCRQAGIAIHIASDKADAQRILNLYNPDFCFVSGWYWLFGKETLDAVPGGFWGVHYSLLPKYRGNAPLVWAIINGEREVGFSIFRLGEGMDDGDILWQESTPITDQTTVRDAMLTLENRVTDSLENILSQMQASGITAKSQRHEDATYCAIRKPADGQIDWHQNASTIHNFVRAQVPPYPGAFTFLGGEKIFLTKTSVFDYPASGAPGRVLMLERQSGTVTVCTGGGTALVIHEVAWPTAVDSLPATQKINSVSATLE